MEPYTLARHAQFTCVVRVDCITVGVPKLKYTPMSKWNTALWAMSSLVMQQLRACLFDPQRPKKPSMSAA